MFRDDLFKGARVLVTGGGTGLGRMMAERLLSLGASVEIWGRRGSVVQATADEMNKAHPGRAHARAVDIKDPDAVDAAVAAMWAEGKGCTHLINNAAGNFVSRTEDLSSRAFHAIADIVFHGTFQVTQRSASAGSRRRPAAPSSPSSSPGCGPAHPSSCPPPCPRPASTP